MNAPLHLHPWRAVRAVTVLVALSAAGLTAAGTAPAAPAPSAASAAQAGPCLDKTAQQRVRADSGLDGSDPNDLTPAQTQSAQSQVQSRVQQRRLSTVRASLGPTTIDVYVHVITSASGSGDVSTARLKKQISVLNKAYAGKTSSSSTKTPFTFRLKHVDRTKNTGWYHWETPVNGPTDDDLQAKTTLHRGGADDLNLYVASLDGGLLGYSTFPWDTTLAQDGVVVLNKSLPGGSAKGYNAGDTVTHEVGHWLGLLHTFENGCTSPGDLVDDTPYQADGDNIFSCSSKLDTCAGPGKDPVHNFMSYGDDKCLDRFTKGQVQRMATVWQTFRTPASAG